jgi:hypothetical protein
MVDDKIDDQYLLHVEIVMINDKVDDKINDQDLLYVDDKIDDKIYCMWKLL